MMSELGQRLRARTIETLSLIADEDAQRDYQAAAPHVNVPSELFNQWDDTFFPNSGDFRSAFDDDEFACILEFGRVLNDVSAATPKELPTLDEFVRTDAWRRLAKAAATALRGLRRD